MNRLPPRVMPCYCVDVMRQCIKKGLTDSPQQYAVQAVARGIDIPVSQLAGQFADMARLRDTPQPEVFRVMLHMFTIVYLLLLPVISYETMGYWIIAEGESPDPALVGGRLDSFFVVALTRFRVTLVACDDVFSDCGLKYWQAAFRRS